MSVVASPQSLRVLCIDGGGIKGYTALLILRRIFRTIAAEGGLDNPPKPCDVFDLIAGTSTGGLIAVMLGRLHMTVDECIAAYEQLGINVFGKQQVGGQLGRIIKGMASSPFYEINNLQEQIRRVLESKNMSVDEPLLEPDHPACKIILCATRIATSRSDLLRNYNSIHPTAENYNCRIWEAASATAAAPMYFKSVKFSTTGERWCDGGLRRNNPINEALAELSRETEWESKTIGCILSLGTGVARSRSISSNLASFLKGSIKIMTDAEDTAKIFAASTVGMDLTRTHRYFRFNVPHGMEDLQLDEWKETERMKALTTEYLSHAGSGDLVLRCAKSLLYPDENLQLALKSKRSMLPYHPCIHFVKRALYDEKLRAFFSPHMKYRQIFALWGLGGVGKTQIALDLAQAMKFRLSVFWVRADNLTNFIADYTKLWDLINQGENGLQHSTMDSLALMERTRNRLEEISGDWLLILDNADHLEDFLGTADTDGESASISNYIPRRGRILITTRDRRFQGSVASASDGLCVELMTASEAEELLFTSVPGHLVKPSPINNLMAKELVEELGYLPLAIAQAAANIVDQQLSFAEYVRLFQEKKRRTNLMQVPAHDFANRDPRNGMQSVAITWKISIDVLKKQSPQSLVFLHYLACFHWRDIPRLLLQSLPDFQNLDASQFLYLVKKPLRLSLIEESQENQLGSTKYSIHPLLHEIMMNEIAVEERKQYLQPIIGIMSKCFPLVPLKGSENWPLAALLAPHVARQLELCQSIKYASESIAFLMYSLSRFYGLSSIFNAGADLADASLQMAIDLFGSDETFILYLRKNKIDRLNDAARYEKSEQECFTGLKSLGLAKIAESLGAVDAQKEKLNMMSSLAVSLRGQHRFGELENIHQQQLQSPHVDQWSIQYIVYQHNLAHTLYKNGKTMEAKVINDQLLEFCEIESGIKVVGKRLHLIMLNLKALIIRSEGSFRENEDKRILLYHRVLNEAMENLGIQDIDTWKALNNVLGSMSEALRVKDMGDVLWDIIPAAIAAKVKAEGIFAVPMEEIHFNAIGYLNHLTTASDTSTQNATRFKELLETWHYISGIEKVTFPPASQINRLNSRGVYQQRRGQYREAEELHRKAIQLSIVNDCGEDWRQLLHYNCMLAIGSSGRLGEALAFREQYSHHILQMEAVHGTLEKRMDERENDYRIYHTAKEMIAHGQVSNKDQWWLDNIDSIHRAECRFGVLHEIEQQAKPIDNRSLPSKGGHDVDASRSHRIKNLLGFPIH